MWPSGAKPESWRATPAPSRPWSARTKCSSPPAMTRPSASGPLPTRWLASRCRRRVWEDRERLGHRQSVSDWHETPNTKHGTPSPQPSPRGGGGRKRTRRCLVGLWSLLSGWGKNDGPAADQRRLRRGHFEPLEDRRLMDADPLKIGVTYLEEDSGSDLHGDTFQILFEGGAPGTELTQLVINGDHGPAGLSVGDMIFDTIKGGLGADEAFNLQVVSSTGIQNVSGQVTDGGTSITFNFQGFNAGEKLVFSIDVDEVQDFDPSETNQQTINEGIDPIASGVEFQSSKLTAKFDAPHYHDIQGT